MNKEINSSWILNRKINTWIALVYEFKKNILQLIDYWLDIRKIIQASSKDQKLASIFHQVFSNDKIKKNISTIL